MTQPQPEQNDDVGGILKRVHMLGSATETLFSRLYGGLNKRKKLTEAMEQLSKVEVRNRQLRDALKEKTIETQRLSAILASISEGIIMQDTEGRIVMLNSAAQELLGTTRNFWASELGVLFKESRETPAQGNEIVPLGEARQVQVNERLVSAQVAGISDQNNARIGTLMILRDVTTDDINERMKNSFVTHISHELITPLAPLRLASEILLNTPDDQPPNPRMLEMISKNIDILDRLVSEMLDMSAMTSGTFQITREQVSLEEMVTDVIGGFKEDLEEQELEVFQMFKHPENLNVMGDKKHLRWTISNLIRNAIQYTLPGNSIWVAVGTERDAPHQVTVEITDSGVGISEEDLPHIFDLFYRGDARTEDGKKLDPRGLGQGLFVAKVVTEAHGGTIHVDSRLHGGSTFRITIPRNMPDALPG